MPPRSLAPFSLLLASLYVGLLVADVVVHRNTDLSSVKRVARAAAKVGIAADTRERLEVVRDLRAAGRPASPIVNVFNVTDLARREPGMELPLVPLSGVGRTLHVNCNESGEWSTYHADRHGFNNPDSLWDHRADFVLLGDSFSEGQCVPEGADVAARIRARGVEGLTLGVAGNGPLATYATFLEYVVPLEPPVVLWQFYDNDIEDFEAETAAVALRGYLTKDSVQGLIDRTEDRDRVLHRLLEPVIEGRVAFFEKPAFLRRVKAWLTLYATRQLVRKVLASGSSREGPVVAEPVRAGIEDLLRRTRDRVHAWGGQLAIGTYPSWESYRYPDYPVSDSLRVVLDDIGARLGIPVFHAGEALPPPDSIWVAFPQGDRLYGHYSEYGYDRVAEGWIRFLRSGGLLR